jgi:hypothetical protein
MKASRVLTLAIVVTVASTKASDQTDALVREFLKNYRTADLSTLTGSESDAVVAVLRKHAFDSSNPYNHDAQVILIRNGDTPTMRHVVDIFRGENMVRMNSMMTLMGVTKQPALIPLVAEDLNINEPAEMRVEGDFLTGPRSVRAANLICEIVGESSAFSEAVRNWAQRTIRQRMPERRENTRVWWRQNETRLKAGDYGSVMPPVGVAPKKAAAEQRDATAATRPATRAMPPTAEPTTNRPSSPVRETPGLSNWLALLCLVLAVCVVAWFVVRLFRK